MSMRQVIPIFIVVILTAYGPLSMVEDLEEPMIKLSGETSADVFDVPSWRIGDKWVYETGFDVNELIAQANVSASIDTLTGDTTVEVVDITFMMIEGVQSLVYIVDIRGDFATGSNSQITTPGGDSYTGRVDIEYRGQDIFRASDLAQWNQTFSLTVTFLPYFFGVPIGIATQTLAEDLEFSTIYNPPREKYDFPLRTGDQWVATYDSSTNVSGTSDYFDPGEFSTPYVQDNTTYQATLNGTPTEDQDSIQYTGCSNSIKVNNWNNTGVSGGFDWYCAAVRNYAWYQIDNPAGFTIDWKLKRYEPVDSSGVVATSSPGIRNVAIGVTPEFVAILPNATEEVTGYFTVNGVGEVGKNLQLRYESEGTILSLTTDSDGKVTADLDVGNSRDASLASDDWSSNGVIIWDPVNKYVGATSIVMDLSVVGVDLVAKPDSMIVTRTRGNDTTILSKASGYNALPGDSLLFQVPAQNRGVLTSPATEMEITTPDGTTIRGALPEIAPYSEARVDVNWTVPVDAAIGNQTLSFMVDPDNIVTADANLTNNYATLDIFIGRMPVAGMVLSDNVYTFENVTIDASSSYDVDGGFVMCYFAIQDGLRTELIDAPDCQTSWFWVDDGDWAVEVTVVDDELDEVVLTLNATILNRDPYVNLTTTTPTIFAGDTITLDATDSGDIDTISPEGQQVVISWPNSNCLNDVIYGPECSIIQEVEGVHEVSVLVTDDDNASVSDTLSYEVLNVAPTIGEMALFIDGIPYLPDEQGVWSVDEGVVVTLEIEGDDTLSDKEDLLITWYPDDMNENWTETTSGPTSSISASWDTSGLHTIRVFVTDNDGVTSQEVIGYVSINNIAPVLDTLPSQKAIYEDVVLNLTASAYDFADSENLRYCWDMNDNLDADDNGNLTDDCDIEGPEFEYAWTTEDYFGDSFLTTITANVWDDDNATDSFSIDVTIVNQRPSADISLEDSELEIVDGSIEVTEGDSVTFSGINSNDTATDKTKLTFTWDDPNTAGATEDGSGASFTIKFNKPGEYLVNLTVTDDDGKTDIESIKVKVVALPDEGIFGMNTPTAIGAGFGILIVVLLSILLLRRRTSDDTIIKSHANVDMGWSEQPVAITPTPIEPIETPSYTSNIQNSGPPLPATGLPEGWTMEQWSYYGEQYLATQQIQPQPAPPNPMESQYQAQDFTTPEPATSIENIDQSLLSKATVQEQAPTRASQELADILDDLDF
ncbi:MAG: hypothetical protein CMB16_04605 [Euryarchaeota archaeon]|nr:hypothetical protein [Euryarchaeota archaeon]|tara:strand:- start:4555 stop:8211 length:3657 start_codon:yes stop_codon:yes gene_type:complete